MKRIDDALDRLLLFVATHASGRGIVAVMVVCYGGVGLVLPIILGASTLHFAVLNFMGTVWAMAFGLVWFVVRLQQAMRRNLVEWTSDLRLLDAREFEWLVGEVFHRDGWTVDEVGGHGSADGNVDLRMRRGKDKALVQCKRWTSWLVGVDEVRKLAGTLAGERQPDTTAYLVTLSDFTPDALVEAKRLGVLLIDGVDLYNRAEKLRRSEPCEQCGSPMLLDRSIHGWWFRCIRPGCKGKRDLGSETGRALELLTEQPDYRRGGQAS